MKINPSERVQARKNHFAAQQQEKIRHLHAQGHKVINLGRGNPDLATFSSIIEKLQEAIEETTNQGYPPYGGKNSLKRAIISFYKKEYDVHLEEDEVTIFSGSLSSLTALPMVLVNPGETVLTPNPSFFGYDAGIKMAAGINYSIDLLEENNFLPDYSSIPDDILENSKLLFLNYPNNPTGAGASKEFFDETVAFAKKHKIVVAHDFAYSDIVFEGKAPSFLQSRGSKDVGVEIYTLSKTFNMAGWRVAFAVGNKEIIALLKDYIRASVGGTFGAVQDAAEFGLLHSQQERLHLRNIYRERKELAISLLKASGIPVIDSKGTFFLWIKLPANTDDVTFVDKLLERKHVAMIPGSVFGSAGSGYIRLSLVSDLEHLKEGIKRLISYLSE